MDKETNPKKGDWEGVAREVETSIKKPKQDYSFNLGGGGWGGGGGGGKNKGRENGTQVKGHISRGFGGGNE